MKKKIRLTESQLHNVIRKCISEALNYSQIKNITGIHDDDELNAAAEAESTETLEDNIWDAIKVKLCDGGHPRKTPFNFKDLVSLMSKFGFNYVGSDSDREEHIFENDKYVFHVYPETFYPNQGMIRLDNTHLMYK